MQVVKYEAVIINTATGTFTFSGAPSPGPPANLLVGQITSVASTACGGTTCFVRKDTTLVPPGYAVTLRLRTGAKPGLFVWHW
jgi:hypothetical protein